MATPMVSGWIALNSSVASLSSKVRLTCSPPGMEAILATSLQGLEDLELHTVDVPHRHLLAAWGVYPEGREGHGNGVDVKQEAGADRGNGDGEDAAHVDGLAIMLPRGLQGRCGHHLLPAPGA